MAKLHFILLASTLLHLSAIAEESPRDTISLKELVVTAPLKTNVELTPLDVTIVGAEEIDKSTESSLLPVLMNKVPGLFVSERGFAGYGVSGGSAGTVNIRGVGGGNKVLFLIDGQPQWAGLFGHSLPDTYVANGVERVEVVKGPSSLLYGSNAMGGSVNIITKHQTQDGVSGKARAMFGSFSTQKFNLSTGYKKGRFSMNAAGQLDRSNGNREGSEFWLANEYLQARYNLSSHWSVGANTEMTQSKANNPGTTQSPLLSMWTKIFRGTASVFANNDYDVARGGIQGFINWGTHKVDDGYAPGEDPKTYLFNSTDYNMGFTLFETFTPWQGNDLSAGIDFLHWGGHAWNTDKADPSLKSAEFKGCENEIAGYVMIQQGFFGNKFSINGGVRLQHGSQYGNVWVPQAGLIYRPTDMSHIKFSFSKGFRAPNLRELYLYAPANPDLKPEYMLNYELSYSQTLLNGRLRLGAALYFIDGTDMIQVQRVDGRPKNMNVGNFINKGFELEGAYAFSPLWRLSANYAYLHTDNTTIYAPKNKLDAELSFTPGAFEFALEDSSVWSLQNGAPEGTEDYTLLNFRAAYTYNAKVPVTLFVKVDNITNKHYEVVYGCPMPGTTVMGGVEFKF